MNTVSRHSMPLRIGLALLAVVVTFGCADPGIAISPEDLGLGQDRPVSLEDLTAQPPDVAMAVDLSRPDLYMPPDLFVECDGGLAACNGACVDTRTSFEHCGMCGNACPGGWNCCGGTCSNPIDSIMNCGACGVVCQVAHGTPACAARMCTIANCDPGYADCVGGYKDGCETATNVNVNNCGACNNACFFSHAQAACNGGKCGIDTCLGLWADCDGDLTNGCELDTGSDIKNCGKCGRACPTPANATPACNAGTCSIGMCAMSFADCDGNGVNGCEVNTATDVKNCAGCGLACPAPANATPGCSGGTCGIGTCNVGFADCDKDASNGCETNLAVDTKNCGACGQSCVAPANGSVACVNSKCGTPTCNPGFVLATGGATCLKCGPGSVLADNPLVFWRLGEMAGLIARDATANKRDGSYRNTTLGQKGVSSDGDPSVQLGQPVDSQVQYGPFGGFPSKAFTIEFWMRSQDVSSDGTPWSYAVNGCDNEALVFNYRNLTPWVKCTAVPTGIAINDGQWHHVVVTWTSTAGELQVFIDTTLRFTASVAANASLDSGGTLLLGQEQDCVGGCLDQTQRMIGNLDEMALFDKVLTPGQVRDHFRATTCTP